MSALCSVIEHRGSVKISGEDGISPKPETLSLKGTSFPRWDKITNVLGHRIKIGKNQFSIQNIKRFSQNFQILFMLTPNSQNRFAMFLNFFLIN